TAAQLLVGPFPVGGVHIHANHPHARKKAGDFLLHPLRPRSEIPDMAAAAGGTGFGHRLRVSAVVTPERPVRPVKGEGDVAVGTLHHLSAGPAEDKGGKTS